MYRVVREPFQQWKTIFFTIFIALIWLFLWYGPWQQIFHLGTWLSMGGSLIIFMIPGLSIYGLLAGRTSRWLNHIPFGFVISHLLIAFFGTLGRFTHASFDLVEFLMMAAGLVSLPIFLLHEVRNGGIFRLSRVKLSNIVSILMLLVILLLTALIVIQRMLADDDVTYLTYITNWRFALHLDFNEMIFGRESILQPRFWLMSVPFAQALISDLGNIPGILILAGYYEPFLVIIAMVGWYELARTLHFSHQAAGLSVVFQILFLFLLSEYIHPGASFFNQLSTDKATATFILAPVMVQSAICVIDQPTLKNVVLLLLTGLSIMLMHPIALAYVVFIVGIFLLINTNRITFRSRLLPFVVLIVILLPQIIFRFAGARAGEGIPYNTSDIANASGADTMISRLGNTPFYGFNPAILGLKFPYESKFPFPKWILKWGWLVIPLSGMFFVVRKLKDDHAAQYIFSTFLLSLLVAVPFTGWIIGYFLSAWMLERALWFFPFGLSTVYLLLSLRNETKIGHSLGEWIQGPKDSFRKETLPLLLVGTVTGIILLFFMCENGLPDFETYGSKVRRYEDIAEVGSYLDQHAQAQVVAIGSEALNDLIPGVSWKAKVITFRISDPSNMLYFAPEEIQQRIKDRKTIFSEAASPEEKLELLRKYDIRYIILTGADRELFAGLLKEYPSLMTMKKVERFFVIEIKNE